MKQPTNKLETAAHIQGLGVIVMAAGLGLLLWLALAWRLAPR